MSVAEGGGVRGRFAPSPTGALHAGHARTFLLAWLRARHAKGSIVMRMEDLDPPRVVPLIGPVQLHHAHYKCTIFFTEVTRVGWPIPYTTTDEDASEVIYIDHNHFHMVGNVEDPSQLPPGAPLQ